MGYVILGAPIWQAQWERVACVELCGAVLHCGRLEVKGL